MVRIALIGDYQPSAVAHRAIPEALKLASRDTSIPLKFDWIHTATLPVDLTQYDGVWCVPASPYANEQGALDAIRFVRENRRPFLGTCGGFQHAMVEFARNVLSVADADHAETAAEGRTLVVHRLSCSLVEVKGPVRFLAGSRLREIYGVDESLEGYHCNFGLNPQFEKAFSEAGLHIAARDESGDPRAVELKGHPFFIATLFQQERLALESRTPPLTAAFVKAAAQFRDTTPGMGAVALILPRSNTM
jgi:CTP synthase (UTP-ammonia lyase)